jgi:repressor LexA
MENREKNLLAFIHDFIDANGYAPTYTEMMKGTGEKSKNGIYRSLDVLVAAGWVTRVEGVSRSIRIMESTPPGSCIPKG